MTKKSTVSPLKPLTAKEKIMADAFLNSGKKISKVKAVMEAYPNANYVSARSMAAENFAKPRIQAYLADHEEEAQQTIVEMMNQRDDKRLALDAAKDIQDRVHGKAKQMVEVNSTSVSMSIDLTGGAVVASKAPETKELDS